MSILGYERFVGEVLNFKAKSFFENKKTVKFLKINVKKITLAPLFEIYYYN